MQLPAPRRYTLRQIVVAVALLVASAGLALLIGSAHIELAFIGLITFTAAALVVCRLHDGSIGG